MGIFSFLDPSSGYGAAEKQLTNYWNQAKGFLSPYATAGNNVLPQLMSESAALSNPEQLQADWINSYQESPEAKQLAATTTQSGMDAASSMGLLGSSPALGAITESTGNIVARDRQNYLSDLMQKYTDAINIQKGIYGEGANAAGQLGQEANQFGQSSANLAYAKGNAPSSVFYGLLGHLIGSSGSGGGALAPVAAANPGESGGYS